MAHSRGTQENEAERVPEHPSAQLSQETRQHLMQATEAKYQSAVDQSATQLQRELSDSGEQIKELVNRLATEIVADEMQRYRAELGQMRERTNQELSATSAEIEKHKEELKAKINQEMEAERQRLMKQIDTKLADAVTSFLLETLQHNVDLGTQSEYLVAMLEEHKKDFVKGVADETSAS